MAVPAEGGARVSKADETLRFTSDGVHAGAALQQAADAINNIVLGTGLSAEGRLTLQKYMKRWQAVMDADARAMQALETAAWRERALAGPKEPCGMYGCKQPKPVAFGMCESCQAEAADDPDAFT